MYMRILFAQSIWISCMCAHIKIYEHQKNLCTHGYINISFVHACASTCEYTYKYIICTCVCKYVWVCTLTRTCTRMYKWYIYTRMYKWYIYALTVTCSPIHTVYTFIPKLYLRLLWLFSRSASLFRQNRGFMGKRVYGGTSNGECIYDMGWLRLVGSLKL